MGPCKKGGTKGELGRSQVKMRESIGRFWHEAIVSSSALARFLATPPDSQTRWTRWKRVRVFW